MTDMTIDHLPKEIPIFPLPRVVLLPRVQLPLNIFEPRYLAMTDHAMANGRLIGMIQPRDGTTLFQTGCVGRIASFSETDDGRYLITLKGVCRFDIASELPLHAGGFRQAVANWSPYAQDLSEVEPDNVCREAMMSTLRCYLERMDMLCDQWDNMRSISCDKLVSTLSVICPFDTQEKQALLEARTLKDRMKILTALLENAVCRDAANEGCGPCH